MAQYQIFLLPLAALALVIIFPLFGKDFSSSRSWRSRRRRRTIVGRIAVMVLLLATLFAVVWPMPEFNTLVQGLLASAVLMAPVLFIYWVSSIMFSKEHRRRNAWLLSDDQENASQTQVIDEGSSPMAKTEQYSIDLSTVNRKKQRHVLKETASEQSPTNNVKDSKTSLVELESPSFAIQPNDSVGNTRVYRKPNGVATSESAIVDSATSKPSTQLPELSSFESEIASLADTKIYKGSSEPKLPGTTIKETPQLSISDTPSSSLDHEAVAADTKSHQKAATLAEPDLSKVEVKAKSRKTNPSPEATKSSTTRNNFSATADDTKIYPNTALDPVSKTAPAKIPPPSEQHDSANPEKAPAPIQGTEFYTNSMPPKSGPSLTDTIQSEALPTKPDKAPAVMKNADSSSQDDVQEHLDKVSSLIQSHDLDEAGFMSPESDESRAKTRKFRDQRLKENAALVSTSSHSTDLTKLSTSEIIQLVTTLRRDKHRLQKLVIAQQASIESERHAHDQTRILTRDAITVMRSARNAQKNAEKLARRERSERKRVEQQYKKIAHALQNAMSIVETRLGEKGGDDPTSAVKNAESA